MKFKKNKNTDIESFYTNTVTKKTIGNIIIIIDTIIFIIHCDSLRINTQY